MEEIGAGILISRAVAARHRMTAEKREAVLPRESERGLAHLPLNAAAVDDDGAEP